MKRKNKVNKILRRVKVSVKKIKKLNRKKISFWLNKNLREHPFILGIAATFWISHIISAFFESKWPLELLKSHFKLLGIISGAWLALVILFNTLKDKQKIKWYFRKRFVFLMLFLFFPVGLTLMWFGSGFKRPTRIIFTLLFAGLFIFTSVRHEKKYRAILNMSPLDRVIHTVTSEKKKAFLKSAGQKALKGFRFAEVSKKEKIKLAVSEIYSRYSPSIVSIKTKDKNGNEIGLGSGFVVSKDGIIVTNSHVIGAAHRCEVKVGEKVFPDTFLINNFPDIDMAVLKINAEGLYPLAIGDSDELASGQFIVALGNPLGLEQSVSSGIISAIRSGRDMKLIQLTAPISPGSSGGPVLNEYGEVVGIATVASFFMAQNVNFAVPINYLKKIILKE
ncbi:trypsin-like serine protease [bacterium]|nr:MAG: trypsin-like serine protease [bacterium]